MVKKIVQIESNTHPVVVVREEGEWEGGGWSDSYASRQLADEDLVQGTHISVRGL